MRTRYAQAPSGWWQDSDGVHQPPGSYADPSLRVGPDGRSKGGPVRIAHRSIGGRLRRDRSSPVQTPTVERNDERTVTS
jgi:hypothetical protein